MLSSGMWKEGPDGSMLRVSPEEYAQTAYEGSSRQARQETLDAAREEALQREGFFSSGQSLNIPDYQYIAQLNQKPMEEWTEQDYRDYALQAYDPANPLNRAFQLTASFTPIGAAADPIGNAIGYVAGKTLVPAGRYAFTKGKQLMNFLRPKTDEITDAATAGFGSIRPKSNYDDLRNLKPEQMQEGLETTNRLMVERLDEFFSEEGQRRARQQIVDQVKYYDNLARSSDETLERLGFDKAQRAILRRGMQKYRGADGAIDLNSAAIAKDLADFNARMRGVANRSGEVVQRANMAVKSDEALANLQRLRNEAYDAGDYQRVADLEDQILQTEQAALTRQQLIDKELTNAFYEQAGGQRSIQLGRENLADPNYATSATIHEMQHAFQDIPVRGPYVGQKLGRTVEADRILDDLVLIDKNNPNIATPESDDLWQDLAYFQQRNPSRLVEKTPFLSEMREDMLSKGYISHRHQEVTDDLMDRYLKDYYSTRNVSTPSTAAGNQNVRILEIMDRNVGPYNRSILKDAMNKMLVAVPAVGAAGVAAGTTAEDPSSYCQGGKLKLKKYKRGGMRVV